MSRTALELGMIMMIFDPPRSRVLQRVAMDVTVLDEIGRLRIGSFSIVDG